MTPEQRAAMRQAREALKMLFPFEINEKQQTAYAALTSALANDALDKMAENERELGIQMQPAQQEPVSGVVIREGLPTLLRDSAIKPSDERLYTRPQAREWVGLTDEEIWNVLQFRGYNSNTIEIARAIEAKLKERNT